MHGPQNHALARFKQLLWFDLDELQGVSRPMGICNSFGSTQSTSNPLSHHGGSSATQLQIGSQLLAFSVDRFTHHIGTNSGFLLWRSDPGHYQRHNVGHLFDIDYLVCLTIQMMALLDQYSSQRHVFKVLGSTVDYDTSTMVVTDWHEVIRLLWTALKSFLTLAQQQEHNLINDKFKIPRLKPLLPKD